MSHLAPGLLAFTLVILLIRFLLRPANRVALLDHPDLRKQHQGAIPLVGGLAMCVAFTMTMLSLQPTVSAEYPFLLLGGYLLMMTGLIDDLRDIPVALRFILQIMALILISIMGSFSLTSLGNLFGSGEVVLGVASVPFTIFCVLGILNAMNMADGLDGLAGGLAIVALSAFGVLAATHGLLTKLTVIVVLVGCIMGFLAFNLRGPWRKRASIFMGDAGSLFLGFVLAWFAVRMSQEPVAAINPITAVWILGLPIMDTVAVMLRRMARGVSPFTSGRDHLHYLMVDSGLSVTATVWLLIAGAALMAGIGVAGESLAWSEPAMCYSFLGISAAYYVCVQQMERGRQGRKEEVSSF